MATDAVLAQLGHARVARWAFDSEAAYRRALKAERIFIERIERELTRQLRRPARLPPPLVASTAADVIDDLNVESTALPIGDSEGLRQLQEAVGTAVSLLTEQESRAVPDLDHLLRHHPSAGLFLPIAFPEPFEIFHAGDHISVGSLPLLSEALAFWFDVLVPVLHERAQFHSLGDLVKQTENLRRMVDQALEEQLALELF